MIEEFAGIHGVDFYGAGVGIVHQTLLDEGYAYPGTLGNYPCHLFSNSILTDTVVASDSHSNTYGGVGCLVCYGLSFLYLSEADIVVGNSCSQDRCLLDMGYCKSICPNL